MPNNKNTRGQTSATFEVCGHYATLHFCTPQKLLRFSGDFRRYVHKNKESQ